MDASNVLGRGRTEATFIINLGLEDADRYVAGAVYSDNADTTQTKYEIDPHCCLDNSLKLHIHPRELVHATHAQEVRDPQPRALLCGNLPLQAMSETENRDSE